MSEPLQAHDRLMITETLHRYAWRYDGRDLELRDVDLKCRVVRSPLSMYMAGDIGRATGLYDHSC